jgi:hypothetical protein
MPEIAPWLCIQNHPIDGLRISNLPGGPKHCYFTSGATHLIDCGYVNLEAARLVANPVAVKAAIELGDSDGNHQWVVTVLVDGPGDYIVLTPEDTDDV